MNTHQYNTEIPHEVCRQFPCLERCKTVTLQPASFSGARVWKVETPQQILAVKQWPMGYPVHLRLSQIHTMMKHAREEGLNCVPAVLPTSTGSTTVEWQYQYWDVYTWVPGEPCLNPSEEQLKQIVRVISQLHAIWRRMGHRVMGPCRAVQIQHEKLLAWQPGFFKSIPDLPVYAHAAETIQRYRTSGLNALSPWLSRKVGQHPCLADCRIEHFLLRKQVITGIVDYGGMRYDHPAQDLARLFGSMESVHPATRSSALAEYASATAEFDQLRSLLETWGLLIAIGNWLTWLMEAKRAVSFIQEGERRLQFLLNRFCSLRNQPVF